MKRKILAIVLLVINGLFAYAQNIELSFGEWKKWPSYNQMIINKFIQPYNDGFLVAATKQINEYRVQYQLLQVDENMDIKNQLILQSTWEYGNRSSALGDYHIVGDTLTCVYCIYSGSSKKAGDYYFVQCCVYDLKNMEMISSKQLAKGKFLNNEKKKWNQLRDFQQIKTKWVDNYVLLELSTDIYSSRCFNFIIYDKSFNQLAELSAIDTFMIMNPEPQDIRREHYYHDHLFTEQGELIYASSRQKLFELSTGADIAFYYLSKDRSKEYKFEKALGNYNLHHINLLKYENGKALLYGLFANPKQKEVYTFDGCCTLECDLDNGDFRVVDWKEFDKPLVGTFKVDRFTEYQVDFPRNSFEKYKIQKDNGWCFIWPYEFSVSIVDDGSIEEIKHNEESFKSYLYQYTPNFSSFDVPYTKKNNDKIYFIGNERERLSCFDSKGNCSSIDLPENYYYISSFLGKPTKSLNNDVYIDDSLLIQNNTIQGDTRYRFGTHNLKSLCQ